MAQLVVLASQVLRLEQQLEAYQKLHTDELAELWRALKDCKRAIAALAHEQANNPVAVNVTDVER